jgi:stage II sporulation protein AA (anti-sigma F factor antagonist)
LDLAVADEFREQLTRAATLDGQRIVLDLTNCDFLDSTGLEVIVRAANRATDGGERIRLVSADGQIRRLIEFTGTDRTVAMFETREEALADIAGAGPEVYPEEA